MHREGGDRGEPSTGAAVRTRHAALQRDPLHRVRFDSSRRERRGLGGCREAGVGQGSLSPHRVPRTDLHDPYSEADTEAAGQTVLFCRCTSNWFSLIAPQARQRDGSRVGTAAATARPGAHAVAAVSAWSGIPATHLASSQCLRPLQRNRGRGGRRGGTIGREHRRGRQTCTQHMSRKRDTTSQAASH